MIGALKYESVRIRTIASSYWMSALALVLTVAIALILTLAVNSAMPSEMSLTQVTTWVITGGGSAVGMPIVAAVFFATMGAMTMGHEYRYGTNKATLSALPDRVAVLSAKVLVLAVWVAAVSVVILLVDLAIAGAFLHNFDFTSGALRPMVNYVGYCVGFALAGFSFSAIFRNQTGAIVAVLVWPLVIEPIVLTILRAIAVNTSAHVGRIYNLLPASAGRRSMFDPYDLFASLDIPNSGIWGLGASTLIYWVAVLGLVAIGSAFFIRRDA